MGYTVAQVRTWTRLSDNDGVVFNSEFARLYGNVSTLLDGLAKTADYTVLVADNKGLVRVTNSIAQVAGKAFSVASPTVISSVGHGLVTGNKVVVSASSVQGEVQNGLYTVTRINDDTFSIPIDNTAGGGGTLTYRDSVVITMPAAASSTDREVQVMKVDANEGAVVATDGSTEYDLTAQNQNVKLKSDGTNWIEVAPRTLETRDYIFLADKKASGNNGGGFTLGAWRQRDINFEQSDTGNHATILANQIILEAGTYECRIICPATTVSLHQARLQNMTDTATELTGTSMNTTAATTVVTHSVIVGKFTITAQKIFQIQHQSSATQAATGFGVANSLGDEYYTLAEFWKVA